PARPSAKPSGFEAVEHAWERNRLAHVLETGDPRQRTLDPDPEARVGHRAVTAQILVPLERFLRQAMRVDAPCELLERGHALAAPDDLAVALRRQTVARQAEPRIGGIGLHVESLHLRGIVGHEDRAVEPLGEHRLVRAAKIAAPLEGLS